MKRYSLDWFESSIYGDLECVDWVQGWIKENLSATLKDGRGNPFYFNSVENKDLGFTLFYDVKPKVKNSPLYLRLTGRFFRLAKSHLFVEELLTVLKALNVKMSLTRVDAAIDFITFEGEKFQGIPYPVRKEFPGNKSPIQSMIDDVHGLTGFNCGKTDSRLRVYDKLLETPEYQGKYGFNREIKHCWRIEHQLRGDSLKALCMKVNPNRVDGLFFLVVGAMFKKFDFKFLDLDMSYGIWSNLREIFEVFVGKEVYSIKPLEVSAYIRSEKSDAGILNYWANKCRSTWHKYCAVSEQVEKPLTPAEKVSDITLMDFADFQEMAENMVLAGDCEVIKHDA